MVLVDLTWEPQLTQRHQAVKATSRHAAYHRYHRIHGHLAATHHRGDAPALRNHHTVKVDADEKPCRAIKDNRMSNRPPSISRNHPIENVKVIQNCVLKVDLDNDNASRKLTLPDVNPHSFSTSLCSV